MKKSRKVFCLWAALAIIWFALSGTLLNASEFNLTTSATYVYQLFYSDAVGNLYKVMEDGTGSTKLVKDPQLVLEAVDSSAGRLIFTERFTDSVWRIFSAKLDMSDVRSLATLSGKNMFIKYYPVLKRVIFALNGYEDIFNEDGIICGIRGNIYSVPITGGSPVKLVNKYAVFHEVIGDRYVYTPYWETSNRDLASVKLDGTGRVNLTWTGYDETYCGRYGNTVIYSRTVNGQKDLYAIPNSGGAGNLKVLANSPENERFAGTSAASAMANSNTVYYLLDNWDLYSVKLDGLNRLYLASEVERFWGNCSGRVIFSNDRGFVSSVKDDGTARLDFQGTGMHWSDWVLVFGTRVIYTPGGDWGCAVLSALADGTSIKELDPLRDRRVDIFINTLCRRLIIIVGSSAPFEIKSVQTDGNNSAIIGNDFPKNINKKYLFSTSNRHVYAIQDGSTQLWALYSETLNSGNKCLLGSGLKEESLSRILFF